MAGELSEVEVQQILKDNYIGRVGCTDGVKVYILPVNYLYEDESVLCCSPEGLKTKMMRKHPTVCFEVDRISNAFKWKCVIVNGVFEEITDPQELNVVKSRYTEYMLRKKVSLTALAGIETENAAAPQSSHNKVFYRVRFKKVTGRIEHGFS